jgi:hypothetical protein
MRPMTNTNDTMRDGEDHARDHERIGERVRRPDDVAGDDGRGHAHQVIDQMRGKPRRFQAGEG